MHAEGSAKKKAGDFLNRRVDQHRELSLPRRRRTETMVTALENGEAQL